jgi:hypothetical protein
MILYNKNKNGINLIISMLKYDLNNIYESIIIMLK